MGGERLAPGPIADPSRQFLAGLSLDYGIQGQILDEILLSYAFPEKVFRGSPQRLFDLKQAASRGRR